MLTARSPRKRMPALFIGHGNPMNALQRNRYTEAWRKLGETLARPRAVLAISAHWYIPGLKVTATERPETIHDFGGFPEELFDFRYPAKGDVALARETRALLRPLDVELDETWGLDHGAWSVLCHIYPDADVPVVQLSIDETKPAAWHYEMGKKLSALRDEGVLLLGSGNLIHDLHTYAWGRHPIEPYPWAVRFESAARGWIESSDHASLIGYETLPGELGNDARMSAPTPEHYLPLLYILGAKHPGDAVSFPVEGVDGGSISMLSVQIG